MIRPATLEDVDWLVDIAIKDMFNLLGNPELYNRDYLYTAFVPYLINEGIALVEEGKGAILGNVGINPFNPKYIVSTELMWWVHEDKRKSPLGYRLLKEFESMSKEVGATTIILSLMPSSPIQSLEKSGYSRKETAWVKGV